MRTSLIHVSGFILSTSAHPSIQGARIGSIQIISTTQLQVNGSAFTSHICVQTATKFVIHPRHMKCTPGGRQMA